MVAHAAHDRGVTEVTPELAAKVKAGSVSSPSIPVITMAVAQSSKGGPEAADALEIPPDVFRKRLQHARAAILSFTRAYCGLVSDTAACACNRRVPAALRVGRIRSDSLDFAATGSSFQEARAIVRQVDEARRALEVHRTSRPRASSVNFAHRLARALEAKRA